MLRTRPSPRVRTGYRAKTGVGLKEAKDAVEAIAAQRGIVAPSRSGCLGVVLLMVLIPMAAIVFGGEQADRERHADYVQGTIIDAPHERYNRMLCTG